jgi:hypothetical protein
MTNEAGYHKWDIVKIKCCFQGLCEAEVALFFILFLISLAVVKYLQSCTAEELN